MRAVFSGASWCVIASGWGLAILLSGCVAEGLLREEVDAGIEGKTGSGLGPRREPGETALPPGITIDDGLSREEAVAIALWNNAAFQEALAGLGLARADLIEAGQLPNPTLGLLFPSGSKQLEYAVRFPAEAVWLRPARIKAAQANAEKIAEDLVQSGLDLARDVRVAYAEARAALRAVKLAEETAAIANDILEIAQARVRAGEASKLDVATAESDVREAKRAAASTPYDARVARERLGHLLGLPVPEGALRPEEGWDSPQIPASVDQLVADAMAVRPDLRAAEMGVEAAGKEAGIEAVRIANFVGILDANGEGDLYESGPGIEWSLPIFHQNQAGRARAKAKVDAAARHYVSVKDRIALEVRESHARARQAEEDSRAWGREIVPPLRESLDLAETAYRGGEVSFLQVLETTRKLTAARLREAEAEAAFERAVAELERSIGRRL